MQNRRKSGARQPVDSDSLKMAPGFEVPDLEKTAKLKQKLQELKASIVEEVEEKLSEAFKQLLDGEKNGCAVEPKMRKNSAVFREKVFVIRNSVLTDLWSINHMRSAFNICTALFIALVVNTGLYYTADTSKLWADVRFLTWSFGNVSIWVSFVLVMHAAVICVLYPGFKFWAFNRQHIPAITIFDYSFLLLYIIFQCLLLVVPVSLVLSYQLSPVSNTIIMMEQTRILMKSYAFFRENLSRAINFNPDSDSDDNKVKEPCPDFQKFLYFLFVPTLVYRDCYPRTQTINWEKVVWLFIQVLACIVTPFIAFQRFIVEMFDRAGREPFQTETFVLILSGCIMVATVFMFCGFYGLLHCWMNLFAELLRFGDRMFYADWWNCTSFHKYYRTWNTVVHDWLYAYLYRDLIKVFQGNQNVSLLVVFLISAIVHEYIIALTLGFLFPIMFIMMLTFGVWVVHLTRGKTTDMWNVFLWWSVCCGWGGLFVLYCAEYYSRKNCPSLHEGLMDFVVPRSWTCYWLQLPFMAEIVNASTSIL